ncbi:hypothetical protein QUF64_12315 [Anaerolineales bacterium HSG6]|nr:hypothetical protein [Anaerolineales bacterium HSG6]
MLVIKIIIISIIAVVVIWYILGISAYLLSWFLLRNDIKRIPFSARMALAFGFSGPLCFSFPIGILLIRKWDASEKGLINHEGHEEHEESLVK